MNLDSYWPEKISCDPSKDISKKVAEAMVIIFVDKT